MVEIKETSYDDERLGFFADQRKLVQKRYDRLEKQIKPDEPYMSERREFLIDLGRELSFYNDIIAMLERDETTPKGIENEIFNELLSKSHIDYDKLRFIIDYKDIVAVANKYKIKLNL